MNSPTAKSIHTIPGAVSKINWLELFILMAGTILMLTGTSKLIGVFSAAQSLDLAEPILGFSHRHLMLITGLFEVPVAFICLCINKPKLSLSLVAWLAANLCLYRAGLWMMGWQHSNGLLIEPLGISLRVSDAILSIASFFLLVGSLAALLVKRKTLSLIQGSTSDSIKLSCPACGGHVKFASQNIGQKIPCPHCQTIIKLRKPDLLKMSCFFCQEHIEFPSHCIGEKMPCPHCNKDITLMEPA